MGYMLHHVIVVETWDADRISEAHELAQRIGLDVSPIMVSKVNVRRSFFVPPDGSKEGWPESYDGDTKRALFVEWLDSQRHGDGSSKLRWVEIALGSDDHDDTAIVNAWRDTGEAAGEPEPEQA
jgi:hypothetical protein